MRGSNLFSSLVIALLVSVVVADISQTTITSSPGYLTYGSGTVSAGSYLQVTPSSSQQAGIVLYSQQQTVAYGFTAEFTYTSSTCQNNGGDGFNFIVSPSTSFATLQAGGSMAVVGQSNIAAVAYDGYSGAVRICTVSSSNTLAWSSCATGSLPAIRCNGAHTFKIIYTPNSTWQLYMDNSLLSVTGNTQTLTGVLTLNSGYQAYVGFAGAGGASYMNQQISSWTFTSTPTCSLNNGGCDSNAACAIVGNAVSCTCNGGYTGNGYSCAAIPVSPPVNPPVDPPVSPPVDPPVTPVAAPVDPPVTPPVAAPVDPPVNPPVTAPVAQPVAAPVDTPVTVPVTPPVTAPVATPVATPVTSPVATPVDVPAAQPVAAPVTTPVAQPAAEPIAAPVTPPTSAPVTPPVTPPVPVTPPTAAPTPVSTPVAPPVSIDVPVAMPVIIPILECFDDLKNGTFIAYFGYNNTMDGQVVVPVGSMNTFGSPSFLGQPTTFAAGRSDYFPDAAFAYLWNGRTLIWTLTSFRLTLDTSDTSRKCPSFARVSLTFYTERELTDQEIGTLIDNLANKLNITSDRVTVKSLTYTPVTRKRDLSVADLELEIGAANSTQQNEPSPSQAVQTLVETAKNTTELTQVLDPTGTQNLQVLGVKSAPTGIEQSGNAVPDATRGDSPRSLLGSSATRMDVTNVTLLFWCCLVILSVLQITVRS